MFLFILFLLWISDRKLLTQSCDISPPKSGTYNHKAYDIKIMEYG
ncbi:hypothetical protein PP742_gp47 [Alcaligenes phage vB_Af_QDWS595]|uniref:Uncharacterized protein n=1 Tax=Alcaligenes phage vB_Af_QDWS595 TaxID=2877946 RepID=A0AAE8Y1F6_9CAUD|nr:hypothetical protein PP742_gp47 [Alcaligenes phage vB_Af_QDWS595]UCR75531.1 hypothetical protein vBAfaPQDWS595_47 [Alcaligenes phage vB_Af_QDWS595]